MTHTTCQAIDNEPLNLALFEVVRTNSPVLVEVFELGGVPLRPRISAVNSAVNHNSPLLYLTRTTGLNHRLTLLPQNGQNRHLRIL